MLPLFYRFGGRFQYFKEMIGIMALIEFVFLIEESQGNKDENRKFCN